MIELVKVAQAKALDARRLWVRFSNDGVDAPRRHRRAKVVVF